MSDHLWTIEELAEFLQIPKATIYGWRYRGEGPIGLKIGRHVRYRQADVEQWLQNQQDKRPDTSLR